MAQRSYTVASGGTFTDSTTGTRYRLATGQIISMERARHLGLPGASGADLVATEDGTGAGQAHGSGLFSVASDDADKIVTLPTPAPGDVVALRNGATGYELRSSSPTTVGINGGVGANAESAIPADTLTVCVCDTSASYLCSNTATDGTVSATEVAAP